MQQLWRIGYETDFFIWVKQYIPLQFKVQIRCAIIFKRQSWHVWYAAWMVIQLTRGTDSWLQAQTQSTLFYQPNMYSKALDTMLSSFLGVCRSETTYEREDNNWKVYSSKHELLLSVVDDYFPHRSSLSTYLIVTGWSFICRSKGSHSWNSLSTWRLHWCTWCFHQWCWRRWYRASFYIFHHSLQMEIKHLTQFLNDSCLNPCTFLKDPTQIQSEMLHSQWRANIQKALLRIYDCKNLANSLDAVIQRINHTSWV